MITLRHALPDEKRKTYEWLCLSDTTSWHMGEPDYPENPVFGWEQFQEDFEDFYYQTEGQEKGSVMIILNDGEEIGAVCYACFHLRPQAAELDIWIKSQKLCGKGCGTEALKQLISYLKESFGIRDFIIRPSEKNARAVRAYQKAGFNKVSDKRVTVKSYIKPEYRELYAHGDYGWDDTAVLTLESE